MAAESDPLKDVLSQLGDVKDVSVTMEEFTRLFKEEEKAVQIPCSHQTKCLKITLKAIKKPDDFIKRSAIPFIKTGNLTLRYKNGSEVVVEVGEVGIIKTCSNFHTCGVKYDDWLFCIQVVTAYGKPEKSTKPTGAILGFHRGIQYILRILEDVVNDPRKEYLEWLRDHVIIHLK